ncbi:hypothetical protein OXYTRIMIC_408 [Oxytricha trifallax]|uniref:Uncharacterized protein n=1 Tax=Oxytricha trifallax TaxID=1172189 RepID=A0A073HWR5_9SPIT|nr:hypothetical protein OXYTRIMIC_408 [Oxytricha trifallax]
METNQVKDPEDCEILATLIKNHLAQNWMDNQYFRFCQRLGVHVKVLPHVQSGDWIYQNEDRQIWERHQQGGGNQRKWRGRVSQYEKEMMMKWEQAHTTMSQGLIDGTNQYQGKLQEENYSKNSLNVKGGTARLSREDQQQKNLFSNKAKPKAERSEDNKTKLDNSVKTNKGEDKDAPSRIDKEEEREKSNIDQESRYK